MKPLEKIIEMSYETKIPATTLVIEYIRYRHFGLKEKVALQYMVMKYEIEKKGGGQDGYNG